MSCAVSCSTAELARPALNTRKAPISSAQTPATRRSFAERVIEDVLETAMTTSVQALGKSLPRSGKMPSSAGRSPGSQRPACYRLRGALTFPGFGITKSGRFVEIEASTPSDRDATQWLFRPVLRTWPAGTIAPVPSPSFRADERPSPLYSRGVGRDCSALNGSTASHSHLLPDPFPDPGTIQ